METPGPRPFLMPVLDIKPERNWGMTEWSSYLELQDILSNPALIGRSDESKNHITLYRSEEIRGPGVHWEQYHPQQQAILRVAQVINMKKEIKKIVCIRWEILESISQSISQSHKARVWWRQSVTGRFQTQGEGRLRAIA